MQLSAKTVREHLLGPVGSLILHVAIVLFLLNLVLGSSTVPDRNMPIIVMEPISTRKPLVLDPTPRPDLTDPKPAELDSIGFPDPTEAALPHATDADSAMVPETPWPGVDTPSRLQIPLSPRSPLSEREDSIRNAPTTVVRPVIAALEWLKNHQAENGSWSNQGRDPVGLTGLGLLAFLSYAQTPASERYGETVLRAIQYLVEAQNERGEFGDVSAGNHGVYSHGIATYAIAEAFHFADLPFLRDPMERGLEVILRGQQPGGLWDYRYRKGDRADLSVSGWQIQALKAGLLAQAEVDGLREALFLASEGLKGMQRGHGTFRAGRPREAEIARRSGHFGYTGPQWRNPGMTGVGVLALQIMGLGGTDMARHGLQAVHGHTPEWDQLGPWGVVGAYYLAQAKNNSADRREWERWHQALLDAIPPAQSQDGSWIAPGNEEGQGRVYATALNALTLMAPYRYLPTFREPEVVTPPAQQATGPTPQDGAVGVRVD